MNTLNDWLTNDPDPIKTLDLIKKKIDWKKRMSVENPVALMRAVMSKEEFDNYWEQKKLLESDFLLNSGYSEDKSMKISWYVPQKVVSENHEHWNLVFSAKQYEKYPYFLLGNPFSKKLLNVTSHFKY